MPWSSASKCGLAPCRARLPGKGGLSSDVVLFLWLDLDLSDLHVDPSMLLDLCTLAQSWLVRARVRGKHIPLSVFPDTFAGRNS